MNWPVFHPKIARVRKKFKMSISMKTPSNPRSDIIRLAKAERDLVEDYTNTS